MTVVVAVVVVVSAINLIVGACAKAAAVVILIAKLFLTLPYDGMKGLTRIPTFDSFLYGMNE